MELIARVNPDHWLSILLIAVIIAPWVYRWRQRLRRWLIRLSLIALGIGIGLQL
jgi:hypothetical protein